MILRSERFFTYSRGANTNFLHEERKMRRLFFDRRALHLYVRTLRAVWRKLNSGVIKYFLHSCSVSMAPYEIAQRIISNEPLELQTQDRMNNKEGFLP